MNKTILVAIVILFLNSCVTSKNAKIDCDSQYSFSSYYLADLGPENEKLISILKNMYDTGIVGEKPMVVIDAIPYVYCDNANSKTIPISFNDIAEIGILDGENGVKLYGKQARNGVALITSKEYQEK